MEIAGESFTKHQNSCKPSMNRETGGKIVNVLNEESDNLNNPTIAKKHLLHILIKQIRDLTKVNRSLTLPESVNNVYTRRSHKLKDPHA